MSAHLPPAPPVVRRDALIIVDIIEAFANEINSFANKLRTFRNCQNTIQTTQCCQVALGVERLTLCELIADLLRGANSKIYTKLFESKILLEIITLFFEHPWNNLLHMVVCDIVNALFENPNCEELDRLRISVS